MSEKSENHCFRGEYSLVMLAGTPLSNGCSLKLNGLGKVHVMPTFLDLERSVVISWGCQETTGSLKPGKEHLREKQKHSTAELSYVPEGRSPHLNQMVGQVS